MATLKTNVKRTLTYLLPPLIIQPLHAISEALHSMAARNLLQKHNKLHLACGTNLLPGWANIDLNNTKGIIKHNLTQPLPVKSATIHYIFSEHFIEHVDKERGKLLLSECFRALIPGGVLRLSTPDLDYLIASYHRNNITEWNDVGWNPTTPCQMINEGMRLWEHKFLYNKDELTGLLKTCGFSKIDFVNWQESKHSELVQIECRPHHHELIIEATK